MTEITERRIEYQELSRVVVVCKHCEAEVTVDMNNEVQFAAVKGKRIRTCHVCTESFDSRLAEALVHFASWRATLKESGHAVSFRVSQ
jgi:hypothetical protein